jgi:hypothetical protein
MEKILAAYSQNADNTKNYYKNLKKFFFIHFIKSIPVF